MNVFEFFAANPEAKECYVVLGMVVGTEEEAIALAGGTSAKPERVEKQEPAADAGKQDSPPPAVTEPVTAPEQKEPAAPEQGEPATDPESEPPAEVKDKGKGGKK